MPLARIPAAITTFVQLLAHGHVSSIGDESVSLSLIHLKDPTIGMLIVCFFSITIIFLTLIIVHDTKTVPWKWLVAIALFVVLAPLESLLWKLVCAPWMM